MSKSVLVVNTPKCCFDCDLWTDGTHCFRCIVANKKYEDNSIVQEWCPLRPLPQFMDEAVPYQVSEDVVEAYQDPYATGWNDCLDEITGATDDNH